jgi:hypothetical protein
MRRYVIKSESDKYYFRNRNSFAWAEDISLASNFESIQEAEQVIDETNSNGVFVIETIYFRN